MTTQDLLGTVLAWCDEHPPAQPVPRPNQYGDCTLVRGIGRSVKLEGEPPQILAIDANLLAEADELWLQFADGMLTIEVLPQPLRYRALAADILSFTVIFERIQPETTTPFREDEES